jgi:hypothetical protein
MNMAALQKAIENLSIQIIYLHSSETRILNDFDPLIPGQELIAQFHTHLKSCHIKELSDEQGEKHKIMAYKTEARMRYLKGPISEETKEDEEELHKLTAAEIIATFASEYSINCTEELPSESVLEFGRLNVKHQVWPYWREYCQSTCARMALPVSVLPMHAINKTTEND